MKSFPNKQKGFTLIELLVVIAIIGVLSTVILASLATARQKASDAVTLSNLHQVQIALELYANDHNGLYPADSTCCIGSAQCTFANTSDTPNFSQCSSLAAVNLNKKFAQGANTSLLAGVINSGDFQDYVINGLYYSGFLFNCDDPNDDNSGCEEGHATVSAAMSTLVFTAPAGSTTYSPYEEESSSSSESSSYSESSSESSSVSSSYSESYSESSYDSSSDSSSNSSSYSDSYSY